MLFRSNFTHFASCCFFALLCTNLFAQEDQHKISIGGGLGVGRFTGDLGEDGSFGLSWNLEANYFLNSKLSAGLAYSSNALGYGNDDALLGVSFYGGTLVMAKADYFFTEKKVRPYVGLGLGLSKVETPEIEISSGGQTSTIPSESRTNFGLSPRLGLMLGNFGIEFAYQIAGKTPKSTIQNVATADKAFNFYTIGLKYVYPFSF